MKKNEANIALLEFTAELFKAKFKADLSIDSFHWKYFLEDFPREHSDLVCYSSSDNELDKNGRPTLLKIKKPEFELCPQPPEIINEWLETGWQKETETPSVKNSIKRLAKVEQKFAKNQEHENIEENEEFFADNEERLRVFEDWQAKRAVWLEKTKLAKETLRLFNAIYKIYTFMKLESDTHELMVGTGLFSVINDEKIKHPMIIKRVILEFDAEEAILKIFDTDAEPEFYTAMLSELGGINHDSLGELSTRFALNHFHPLDSDETEKYLKIVANNLSPHVKYVNEEKDESLSLTSNDHYLIRQKPMYFVRKRVSGVLKAIGDVIDVLRDEGGARGDTGERGGTGPSDRGLDEEDLEKGEILFSKESNAEQLEIARRVERHEQVLVQGPPGTGKTHTIANLLGHFLAQGKSVLITSHTKKALSVLRDQIVEDIQDLCVFMLDDNNVDMKESVEEIVDYMACHSPAELKREIQEIDGQRNAMLQELEDIQKKLFIIKNRECNPIVYKGKSYSISELAAYVNEHAKDLSYIPGQVKLYSPLPLYPEELKELYQSNISLTKAEEKELAIGIPPLEALVTPQMFSQDLEKEKKSKEILENVGHTLLFDFKSDYENGKLLVKSDRGQYLLVKRPTSENIEDLEAYLKPFKDMEDWMVQAAIAGLKDSSYKRFWEDLIASIEDINSYTKNIEAILFGKNVSFDEDTDLNSLEKNLKKLSRIIEKRRIKKMHYYFNKSLESTILSVKVNGHKLESSNDCLVAISYLGLIKRRKRLAKLWDELMAKNGAPKFSDLATKPEEGCRRMLNQIKYCFYWKKEKYEKFKDLLLRAGFNFEEIFVLADLDREDAHLYKILMTIKTVLPLYLQAGKSFAELSAIWSRRERTKAALLENKHKGSAFSSAAFWALENEEPKAYEEAYLDLILLPDKQKLQENRLKYLSKIKPLAPEWAKTIENREGIHGESHCPETIEDAWEWKQFAGIIDDILAEPYEELLRKENKLTERLREITSELIASKTWYHQLIKIEKNQHLRKSLISWKQTIEDIGAGTGKRAAKLKREALKLMAECQPAVPVWVMPINKVFESLDFKRNKFDLLIVDEASQADLTAFAILPLAKKAIIVGDDKQVSPLGIGTSIDTVNALQRQYLEARVDNPHLYDERTSLYEYACLNYRPIMLREHFRCVPEIIGYSNKFSYDYKIMPLRDASNCKLLPAIVNYRVGKGKRHHSMQVNKEEAKHLVALIMACLEQDEYEGKSFGVITLLGKDQGKLIQTYLHQKITAKIIEERGIICGNPSQFQGDERDVIFLSMVDSGGREGPLSLRTEGSRNANKQRYNVAVSRAKDQLWLVHSLDYSIDLKPGDIRRGLLEYVENPSAFALVEEKIKNKSDSYFEEKVAKSLFAAGYNISQQWKVGSYRIDIVVQYKDRKIALECDGERYHSSPEQVQNDWERQKLLERMGWKFIRIRGSEYFRNPEKAMKRVFEELKEYEIFQETALEERQEENNSDLLERVKIRANQILMNWDNEEKIDDWNINFEESRDNASRGRELGETSGGNTNKPINNSEDIVEFLKEEGIAFVDQRERSGIIWVLYSDKLKDKFKNRAENSGHRFSFEARGSLSTAGKPAWRIMVS